MIGVHRGGQQASRIVYRANLCQGQQAVAGLFFAGGLGEARTDIVVDVTALPCKRGERADCRLVAVRKNLSPLPRYLVDEFLQVTPFDLVHRIVQSVAKGA